MELFRKRLINTMVYTIGFYPLLDIGIRYAYYIVYIINPLIGGSKMTYLERLTEEKNHAILVEKIAFLMHFYEKLGCNMPKFAKEWNKKDIKNTTYGTMLFYRAEEIAKIKLKEDI